MSLAKQHQEWLQLLEVSGPFLAMPVIARTFPQGLERIDSGTKRELRLAYQEWVDSHSNEEDLRKYHTPWVRYVLKNLLEFPSELLLEGELVPPRLTINLPEHGELLRPDMVVMPPNAPPDSSPRILISVFPAKQKLDRSLSEKTKWIASPATRMMELLKRSAVRVGIVTNGEHWLLVYSPESDTTSFVGWYASVWMEEELTVRSFKGLMSAYRFFGVPEPDMLETMFDASTEFQHEVTTQLGGQVRRAIEQLVQALDQIDKDSGRALLRNVSEAKLYEAGVSVMMRLVFLLTAEERELFPINNPIYSENYAILTLREHLEQLASRYGEEVLERRYDAWNRLLATFRAIFAGVRHEDFNLPAYGGSLFDPDRYPFLEGRAPETIWHETNVIPLSVNDRTVLHLLDSLQLLRGTGSRSDARKLSFRGLDVEQIGHVYESLLEHTAVRAEDLILGLEGAQGREPEVPISKLQYQSQLGEDGLLGWLHDETGKSVSALSKLLKKQDRYPDYKVRAVCDNQNSFYSSAKPFIGLVREDSQHLPVIFTPGSVYVTEGSERRSTGTHYTPRSLTEPIVKHTLDPLIYRQLADGVPPSLASLRSPREILDLKICDMTCGSGAFLVQACRYLSERLTEAWAKAKLETSASIDIYGDVTTDHSAAGLKSMVPDDPSDALLLARRLIADRCIYGVDCNSMAVEMAKLSLWLITMQKDRPFTFLDHAIRCGDSLVGVHSLDQLELFELDPSSTKPLAVLAGFTSPLVEDVRKTRIRLEHLVATDICDTGIKEKLHSEAEDLTCEIRLLANAIVCMSGFIEQSPALCAQTKLNFATIINNGANKTSRRKDLDKLSAELMSKMRSTQLNFSNRSPFQWVVEFPEVFIRERPGFDAIIGNPPFMGGSKISGALGSAYRDYLVSFIANSQRGNADLCAYFFLRLGQLLRKGGYAGMVATNTIAQGDTREVGLEQLEKSGAVIFRAVPSMKWPGQASLEVSLIWLTQDAWRAGATLADRTVSTITTMLSESLGATDRPRRLPQNAEMAFNGSYVHGTGFLLTPTEAQSFLDRCDDNKSVLFPYLTGEDLLTNTDQSPTRWVIYFKDFPLSRTAMGNWNEASAGMRKSWLKAGTVPSDYPKMVAEDFAELLDLVRIKVKPDRDKLSTGNASARDLARRWWQLKRPTVGLYEKLRGLKQILVTPQVSPTAAFHFAEPNTIFSHKLIVFATDSFHHFGVLQSSVHREWTQLFTSTLGGTTLNYSPTDCFETFPMPVESPVLQELARNYFESRKKCMSNSGDGLTKLYGRFHNESVRDEDIELLRQVHRELDLAVLDAYGISKSSITHGFFQSKQGPRYSFSPESRSLVLRELLKRNHSHAP